MKVVDTLSELKMKELLKLLNKKCSRYFGRHWNSIADTVLLKRYFYTTLRTKLWLSSCHSNDSEENFVM